MGAAVAGLGGGWVYGTVVPRGGLPGQFRAPLQLHRGPDRLDALASRSNGLTERSPEPLIGFDHSCACSSGAAIGASDTNLFC